VLRTDLATTVNRARTDALQRRPYCLSSEGVEREYKRTGREEQGLRNGEVRPPVPYGEGEGPPP
jgi:hypothetical protein